MSVEGYVSKLLTFSHVLAGRVIMNWATVQGSTYFLFSSIIGIWNEAVHYPPQALSTTKQTRIDYFVWWRTPKLHNSHPNTGVSWGYWGQSRLGNCEAHNLDNFHDFEFFSNIYRYDLLKIFVILCHFFTRCVTRFKSGFAAYGKSLRCFIIKNPPASSTCQITIPLFPSFKFSAVMFNSN